MSRLAVTVFLAVGIWNGASESPVVKTNSGPVRGKTVTTPLGKEIDAFLGIPYAQPPLGKLRFKPPLEVNPWEDVVNATEDSCACFQKFLPLGKRHPEFIPFTPTTQLCEDCLTLNIWVPRNKPEPVAVMVYIYGGGHSQGATSAPIYDGSILSSEEEVIVVIFNYRVASFGFLFLDHPEIPGNAGLYDQLLALKWIKENIGAFGGDPESITLFGTSSGSASVGLHLLSPLSRGLFNRAIMQSASPTAEWNTISHKESLSFTVELLKNIGCPHDLSNKSSIIDCLQTANAEDILGSEYVRGFSFSYTHMPVVDGKIIPDMPATVLREKMFSNVSILTGSVKDEAGIFLILIDPVAFSFTKDNISVTRDEVLDVLQFYKFDKLTLAVLLQLYFGDNQLRLDNSPRYVDAVLKLASDFGFTCPLTDFEIEYSKAGNNVFKYYLPHHGSARKSPKWTGTTHGEELYYIYGDPFRVNTKYTNEDKVLSRRIMRYWTNFARTGDPNNSTISDENAIYWPRHTPEGREYLVLAPNTSATGRAFREKYCVFWRELRPSLPILLENLRGSKYLTLEDNS